VKGPYIRVAEFAHFHAGRQYRGTWRYAARDEAAKEIAANYSDVPQCLGLLDKGEPIPFKTARGTTVIFYLAGRLDLNGLEHHRRIV
jgi:hypothetical protein